MSITRLQQARQMYATGQRVGRIAFQGGGASYAAPSYASSSLNSPGHPRNNPSNNISPSRVGNTNNFTGATKGTLSDPQEKMDFVGETIFGPTQKYTGKGSLFGGANRYGYTDQYVNPTKSNFGNLKPGYGGRFFGGLASLFTGIPFVGNYIGGMYDKGQGLFKNKYYNDMSKFNQLGLGGVMPEDFEDEKISLTSFTENDPLNIKNMILPLRKPKLDMEVDMEAVDEFGNTYRDSPYSSTISEDLFNELFNETLRQEPG
tara:strand:- start:63 stop:842 length:780 start_codon:yes stop_codon:yes gene_type:complete